MLIIKQSLKFLDTLLEQGDNYPMLFGWKGVEYPGVQGFDAWTDCRIDRPHQKQR